jgi:hypothetical protein
LTTLGDVMLGAPGDQLTGDPVKLLKTDTFQLALALPAHGRRPPAETRTGQKTRTSDIPAHPGRSSGIKLSCELLENAGTLTHPQSCAVRFCNFETISPR